MMKTTYSSTISGVDAREMKRRCTESLRDMGLDRMVAQACGSIPLELESNEEVKTNTEGLSTARKASPLPAQPRPAFQRLEATLLELAPRPQGVSSACVREFFTGGSCEGPFPGARSKQGEWMAATYFSSPDVQHSNGSTFAVGRHQKRSVYGFKMH